MSGNKVGGAKAANTNRERYGQDFYKKIGALGGKIGHAGGFASDKVGKDGLTGRQRASKVGIIGGTISRRGSKHVEDDLQPKGWFRRLI